MARDRDMQFPLDPDPSGSSGHQSISNIPYPALYSPPHEPESSQSLRPHVDLPEQAEQQQLLRDPAQVGDQADQPDQPPPPRYLYQHRGLIILALIVIAIIVVGCVFGAAPAYQSLYKLVTNISHRYILQRNQVQQIVCFNPKNVDKVIVSHLRSATNGQLMDTSVSLGLVPRESLTPHWDNRTLLNYTFGSNLVTNYPLQKWMPFAYMLAGSSVELAINITFSSTSTALGSLNEYNDYEKYIQFSQGTTNEPEPYQRFPINTTVGTAVTTPIAVHEDGFILFGFYLLLPSSWYYAYSFRRLYYKSSDYSFDCTLYNEDSLCHLSVTESSHSELCLMAYTQGDEFDDEGPDFVEASYAIVTQELRVFTIVALGTASVAAVVVVLVIVSYMVWAYRRRRRPA